MPNLGGWEWVILALIALLLFGGSRLAGIGRNTGRAIREFREETATHGSSASPSEPPVAPPAPPTAPPQAAAQADPDDPERR